MNSSMNQRGRQTRAARSFPCGGGVGSGVDRCNCGGANCEQTARPPSRNPSPQEYAALLYISTNECALAQCASSQFCAARASTASGTDSERAGSGACAITFSITGKV